MVVIDIDKIGGNAAMLVGIYWVCKILYAVITKMIDLFVEKELR